MSEGDVSLIRDEDLLRRMWQQTEDFTRKKEIRAHMYRLREERLRNLYSPEPPLDTGKGCEFTSAQAHVKSFADQSFQSMKSKEVRDAGSPPKEFAYRGQDLKELSNAGWNVESENRTSNDGHTHTKSVQANIEGNYDVEGGKGHFVAVDHQKKAVTEYHDENTSMKKNETSSRTAAHEQVVRKSDDGNQFCSTTSSSTSTSKCQQVSSTKHETVPYITSDDFDLSRQTSYDNNRNVEDATTTRITKTSNYEQKLRNEFDHGELVSRKVDYPDESTKIIVETRRLPDGTRVTSTRREIREPVVHTSRSEQHSRQSKSENSSTYTSTQKHSDVRESAKTTCVDNRIKDIVDSQKNVDNYDFNENQVTNYSTSRREDHSQKTHINQQHNETKVHKIHQERVESQDYDKKVSEFERKHFDSETDRRRYDTRTEETEEQRFKKNNTDRKQHEIKVNEFDQKYFDSKSTKHETITSNDNETAQDDFKKSSRMDNNEERIHTVFTNRKSDETIEKSVTDQYQTSYQSDYSQKKVSLDWSPTHQAWASTLRADTPSTTRPSTRASSPGSRTLQSSTSSLRSSVSPDKSYKKVNSRGTSPNKMDRYSPSRRSSDKQSTIYSTTDSTTEIKIAKHTSPDRKYSKIGSPTRTIHSPDRNSPSEYNQRRTTSPGNKPQDFTNRQSISPERKPGYKSTESPSPKAGSPTRQFENKNTLTSRPYPETKPQSEPADIKSKTISSRPGSTSPHRSITSPDKKTKPTRLSQSPDKQTQKLNENYPRSTSPLKHSPKDNTVTRLSLSPERKSSSTIDTPKKKPGDEDTSPTRLSVSPERKPGFMKPTVSSNAHSGDDTRKVPYSNSDTQSKIKGTPFESPESKTLPSTIKKINEDHYKFVKEETKMYTELDVKDVDYNTKYATNPEELLIPQSKNYSNKQKSPVKDISDDCRPVSPLNSTRSSLRKDSRSPSPPKGPVTFIHDETDKDDKYLTSGTRTYDKINRYSKETDVIKSTTKDTIEDKYDSLTRRTSPKRIIPTQEPTFTSETKKINQSEQAVEVEITSIMKEDEYNSSKRRISPKKDMPTRISSPPKHGTKICRDKLESSTNKNTKEDKSDSSTPEETTRKKSPVKEPSPSTYGTYDKKQRHSEEITEVTKTRTDYKKEKNDSLVTRFSPEKDSSSRKSSPFRNAALDDKQHPPENVKRTVVTTEGIEENNYGSFTGPALNKVKESSPPKYDKKQKRTEDIEEVTVSTKKGTKEVQYDAGTQREKSSTPKRLSGSPLKPSRESTSPLKSTKDDKYKLTTDFIAIEKKSEEVNKTSTTKDRPRQLVTPSTSPTRKPKPVEREPSTGQSSPTTSVSGFVYFSSPRMETSDTTELKHETLYSETRETLEDRVHKKTEDYKTKRMPSPSKIPCKSPSPERRSYPTNDGLPRRSSLKKPSDSTLGSPTETPPQSFRVSPPMENTEIPSHKIVKKDQADRTETDIVKPKPPLERRETYEERCRKILGMMDDNSTTNKTIAKEPMTHLSSPKFDVSSPSVSPCPSPDTKDDSSLEYSNKTTTKMTQIHCDTTESLKLKKENIVTKVREASPIIDRKISSRGNSPTKLQDIITETKTSRTEDIISATEDVQRDNTFTSKTITTKQPSTKSLVTVAKKVSEKTSSIPKRSVPINKKLDESRTPRSPSPTKKTVDVTKNTIEFISSEQERDILDRVQKSINRLSPNRNEKSPSRERSPTKTTPSLQDIDIIHSENLEKCDVVCFEIERNAEKSLNVEGDKQRPTNRKDVKDHSSIIKPASRNTSPIKKPIAITPKTSETATKQRSISPRKPITQTERSQSPQVPKTIKSKETISTHGTRRSSGSTSPTKTEKNITTDIKKSTAVTKQKSYTSKTTVAKTTTNKIAQPPTADIRRISSTKHIKEPISPKRDSDVKVTRTSSDINIKTNKMSPQRMRSKPEIQINDVSTTKRNIQTNTTTKTQKSTTKENQKLASKPKSATALNTTNEEDDVIIDVEQAKSSRENSPDRICPTPVNFLDDVGTPRLPDEVSEPDDEFRRRTHHTIHEAESIVDDIVEISEDDELFVKVTKVDNVTDADECIFNVNDKFSKFNKAENIKKSKDITSQFKDTERKVHSDFVGDELKSDECLLSVSEKVNKFAKGSRDTKDRSPLRKIIDEYDTNTTYQDDYTKLSVNDKAHLFVETAENLKTPKKKSTIKVERPDLSDVDDSLKSDDCLLSVSDKVNKFVKTAEKFLTESYDTEEQQSKIKAKHESVIRKITESTDDEVHGYLNEVKYGTDRRSSEHREDKLGSFAKETTSSHAKAKDYISPNIKTSEKVLPTKITTLRSSEAVKKAKALFENIASTAEKTKDMHQTKTTKLTDIGVMKKPSRTDSTIVHHPSLEDGSTNHTDVDSEIDTVQNTKSCPRSSPTRHTTSDSSRFKSPIRQNIETTYFTKSQPRQPSAQRVESPKPSRHESDRHENLHDKIPSYQRPTKTSQIREEMNILDETEISSRRGSGKFGVELRRTSIEHSTASSERRRSSGDHHQPCIEDIFDLDLLEQMLEKVVGYEQRRRIRAQIRIAKKRMEDQHTFDTATYTKTTKKTTSTVPKSPERQTKKKSPERSPNATMPDKTTNLRKTLSPDRGQIREFTKAVRNGHGIEPETMLSEKRHQRPSSPDKPTSKSAQRAKSPTQQPTETRTQPSSKTQQSRTNRFSEYASAYMKKVGLNENQKINVSGGRTERATDVVDHHGTIKHVEKETMETKSTTMSKSVMEKTSSKDVIEVIKLNGKRTPSPGKTYSPERKTQSPERRQQSYERKPQSSERKPHSPDRKPQNYIRKPQSPERKSQIPDEQNRRTPSPSHKTPKNDSLKKETIIKTVHDIVKIQPKQVQEEKPSWVTNRNLKKVTSETRTVSTKKLEVEKPKYRSSSPSKAITKPTDVITSSYGPGPLDADGRPLFGIRALRKGATNYQVKGTVIRQEYHSHNGSEPEGTVSVTAYSTQPEDLERLLQTRGERPSRMHGLAAITTTKKFGGDTGTTLKEAHTKEEHASLEHFTQNDRRRTDRMERKEDKKTVRQSSVKSLTEKYIKSASDTNKSERSAYPKAGLILRTSNMKDSISSDDSTHGDLRRADSEHSLASVEERVTKTQQIGDGTTTTTTTTTMRTQRTHGQQQERSFLDSNTKVTGVQDILTRMKNADIVIEDGDSNEDAEARALLNKFLGASVLMAGMQGYVNEGPTGKVVVKQETVRNAGGKVSTSRSVQEFDLEQCWDERVLRKLLDECTDYEQRRRLRARIKALMAEQEACASAVTEALAAAGESTETAESTDGREEEEVTTVTSSVRRNSSEKTVSSSTTTKTSKVIESMGRPAPKPVSPFAKFRQLEKQNSTNSPNTPASPQSPSSGQPLFKFTEPALQASANTIKERLLQWCRDKTRDYENVKLENFSTSWADGLAFCALIHHFLPDAFDYTKLTPDKRRHNFTLAFKVADEKAGIYPLLDVEDMVAMRRPDWKCVFTYVQSIHRRFKDQH